MLHMASLSAEFQYHSACSIAYCRRNFKGSFHVLLFIGTRLQFSNNTVILSRDRPRLTSLDRALDFTDFFHVNYSQLAIPQSLRDQEIDFDELKYLRNWRHKKSVLMIARDINIKRWTTYQVEVRRLTNLPYRIQKAYFFTLGLLICIQSSHTYNKIKMKS